MKIKITYMFLVFISSFALAFGQDNTALFDAANKAYNDGNYAEAIVNYKSILETENHSAAIYYNLGNAYYKRNEIGPSVYYFEKALQLSPNDTDILNNLAYAKNMTIDAIEALPKTQLSKFVGNITGTFTYNQWAWIAVICGFLCVISFLLYQFAYQTLKKRIYFIVSFITFLFILGTVAIAYQQYGKVQKDRPAIIFATETTVKAEPNLRSDAVFVLHEGTKVQVLDTIDSWKKIQLIDGKTGWIVAEDVNEL
ncbi:Photosystem I assembly protein Ycf3 [Kordia antarctica]|uniref:Photosystem I assembly protein Ycf3 n=1 Tax=Kordia antarctica TaxID=1218801 RepID=A0A7L4ZMC5_9FLAO|nr:SH3 domain-containing protein [Kordia antarctica]QHI37681.1 Photosystem I assembly protein Ycf3 [Kordia antarctica]